MSLPRELSDTTLARITTRWNLQEVGGPEGGPFMTLKSAGGPAAGAEVGWVRVFNGKPLQKVVAVGLVVPQFGLDSHMIFAFTPAESAIPHFTIDAVKAGDMFAFHLDLIPRADLGANLAYMNAALHPLTPVYEAARAIDGLTPAKLAPRQLALMSPWMLAHRATEAAFAQITAPVTAYLDHWFGLVERGISPEITAQWGADALAKRDRDNRLALFSPEIDPVWNQVDRLVGGDVAGRIRDLLKSQNAVSR